MDTSFPFLADSKAGTNVGQVAFHPLHDTFLTGATIPPIMPTGDVDAPFPECCTRCPHIESVTGACTHRYRQAILGDLDDERPCPIYITEKTAAMDRLSRSVR